jgi:hypothetical protein
MDKNKFWLGGRLFNTASPRLAAPTQCKERPQDGCPNTTQGLSASWVPTQCKARLQVACPNVRLQRNARHVRTSATWVPQRNARHIRKLGARTHVWNANTRHVHTSTSWAPQRNAMHVRKLGTQTQRKASSQDGRPNEKLIHNENVNIREH